MNRVMNKPITDARFVDVPRLWIIDFERQIAAVPPGFVREFPMKNQNIVQKIQCEFGDVFAFPFPAQKFPPGFEQVVERYDMMIGMTKPLNPPPP